MADLEKKISSYFFFEVLVSEDKWGLPNCQDLVFLGSSEGD